MKFSRNKNQIMLASLALLLFHAELCLTYSLISNQLLDLQGTDSTAFKVETDLWRASALRSSSKFSTCNGIYLLGGYSTLAHSAGQYFQRVYTNLPDHQEIRFSIVFWMLDYWTNDDKIELMFDSTVLQTSRFTTRTGLTDLCGEGYIDLPSIQITGRVAHSDTTLTFRAISQLTNPTTIGSFGLRDLKFDFVTQLSSYVDEICTVASITLPSDVLTCKCSSNQYEQPTHSGQCFQCHSDCATCTGPSSTSCASCSQGKFLDTSKQCITCHKSCATCNGPSFADCLICASGYILTSSQNAKNSSCTLSRFQGVSEDSFLNAPMEANTATLIVLAKTMQYVRYLDINMPPRLQQLGYSRGREILSLRYGFDMPEGIKENFARVSLPAAFEKLDLHSSFLVNFWQLLTSFGIILVVSVLSMIFEIVCHHFKKELLHKIIQVFRVITTWNFCFILFATSVNDIIIFCYLEFQSFSSNGGSLSNFSLFASIVLICAIIAFIIGIIMINRTAHVYDRLTSEEDSSRPFILKWEGCRALFDGFRTTASRAGRFFFLIYLIRLSVPAILAICLQNAPTAQAVLQIFITLTIIVFILYVRPLKNKVNHIQLVIIEVLTLLMNILVLALAIMSSPNTSSASIMLGDFIIIGNFLINLILILILVIKIWIEVKKIISLKKEQPRDLTLTSCLQLLGLPLQQGGMGFEQVFEPSSLKQEDNIAKIPLSPNNAKIFPAVVVHKNHSPKNQFKKEQIVKNEFQDESKATSVNGLLLPPISNFRHRASIENNFSENQKFVSENDGNQTSKTQLPQPQDEKNRSELEIKDDNTKLLHIRNPSMIEAYSISASQSIGLSLANTDNNPLNSATDDIASQVALKFHSLALKRPKRSNSLTKTDKAALDKFFMYRGKDGRATEAVSMKNINTKSKKQKRNARSRSPQRK